MDDTINRQTAIEALYSVLFDDDLKPIMVSAEQADKILDAIRNAPSSRHGRWIRKEDQKWHCSLCDSVAPKGIRWKYCVECGARMDG